MNKIRALLLLIIFSLNSHAEGVIDSVTSVKLNGFELYNGTLSFQEVDNVFGQNGSVSTGLFSECTGNFDIDINYPNKSVRLEFYPEDNSGLDLDRLFSQNINVYKKSAAKARVWIEWQNMSALTESLTVGGLAVTPDLSFETFQRFFPVSADKANRYSFSENGMTSYFVIGSNGDNDESEQESVDLAYIHSVKFTFKDGTLFKLEVLQGIAC